MRWLAILVLAPVAVALGGFTSSPASVSSLKISYWPNGQGTSGRQTWTLRCDPAGGTLGRTGVACRRLASGGGVKLFAPVPDGAVCTEIYGGPQMARIVGLYKGKRVWANFSRTNGCHISRWDRLSPWLLPSGGA